MNSSLKITADENGYFRHPEGHPLVVIFDSKHGDPKTAAQVSWQHPVIGIHPHEPDEGKILLSLSCHPRLIYTLQELSRAIKQKQTAMMLARSNSSTYLVQQLMGGELGSLLEAMRVKNLNE